ncbi:MAG: hypothetical protein ACRENP_20680 [Longimicrobiales bacterium]
MSKTVSRVPSVAVVLRQQLRLIDRARAFPVMVAILAGLSILSLGLDLMDLPWGWLPLPGFLIGSIAWAPLVWRGQGLLQRQYHRTLPVNHLQHDLLKIAAGAIWLCAALAIVLLPILGAAALREPGFLTGPSPLVWLAFFTGPLIVYLLVSCVPLLTNRPLEWMLGITAGMVGLYMLAEQYRVEPIQALLAGLFGGGLGLGQALGGAYRDQPWEAYVGLESTLIEPSDMASLMVTGVWLVVAFAAVCTASRVGNKMSA